MKYSEAGKGSAPRKNQNMDAYRSNWDLIFGKKNEDQTGKTKTEKSSGESSHSAQSREAS